MKNRKGFTLIELLAIIVILAIIAVITVPIILNIIETSRKGAATDSAYGYTDAVEKFYTSNLFENRDLKLNGAYVIDDGEISGTSFNNVQVPTSGNVPTQGVLFYLNNRLINGCLVLNDYQVEYSDGKFNAELKGDCSSFYEATDDACFQYTDNGDGTATITSYLCGTGTEDAELSPVVPYRLGGLNVTTLAIGSLASKGLNSVTLPPTLIKIDRGALAANNLTSIVIPDSVLYLEGSALLSNKLTSVTLSNNLLTIGDAAFINNLLEEVEIPNSVVLIDNAAFQNNKLKDVEIPSSVKVIGVGTFEYNELETVTFNEGLETIRSNAFHGNKIQNVKIPSSVTTIQDGIFWDNVGLKKIEFPNPNINISTGIVYANKGTLEQVIIGDATYTMDNIGSGVVVGNITLSKSTVNGIVEIGVNNY